MTLFALKVSFWKVMSKMWKVSISSCVTVQRAVRLSSNSSVIFDVAMASFSSRSIACGLLRLPLDMRNKFGAITIATFSAVILFAVSFTTLSINSRSICTHHTEQYNLYWQLLAEQTIICVHFQFTAKMDWKFSNENVLTLKNYTQRQYFYR